jgi:hypothetical protein
MEGEMMTKEEAYESGYRAQKIMLQGPGGLPKPAATMKKRELNWFWVGASICRDDRILIAHGGASPTTILRWHAH